MVLVRVSTRHLIVLALTDYLEVYTTLSKVFIALDRGFDLTFLTTALIFLCLWDVYVVMPQVNFPLWDKFETIRQMGPLIFFTVKWSLPTISPSSRKRFVLFSFYFPSYFIFRFNVVFWQNTCFKQMHLCSCTNFALRWKTHKELLNYLPPF